MKYKIAENKKVKLLRSNDYNYLFDKCNGQFYRWGKVINDDPDFSPAGPEIADIEISTVCSGIDNKPCRFCYKCNSPRGESMSLDTFKVIFHNLPRSLTQIAFGIGDIDANPDIWDIFSYCRTNDYNYVVPNVTINGARMTDEYYNKLSELCGAVAVSRYNPPDYCYNAVQELTNRGMRQVNIHMLLAEETYKDCLQVIEDAATDPRLENLNTIVFLTLKPTGRGKNLTSLRSIDKYRKLVDYASNTGVGFGFDSCGAPIFLKSMAGRENYNHLEQLAEPCESYLFSIYINTKGITYPCSFAEEIVEGIDLTQDINYWHAPSTAKWRNKLLNTATQENCLIQGCRQCPIYDIY